MKEIQEIHESLINGQRKQMVNQIDKYGNYDFWCDYAEYLNSYYACDVKLIYAAFRDATISYFRIKNR